MTEKRFTIADGFKIVAIRDNGKIMNSKQVCNKLNELHEENQQYREWLEALREELSLADRDNTALEKENKELKSLCKVLITHIDKKGIAFVIDEEVRRLLE